LTLVFDKGNGSKENLARLEDGKVRYVGAIPGHTKSHHGKGYSKESVRRQIGEWTGRDHLREYFKKPSSFTPTGPPSACSPTETRCKNNCSRRWISASSRSSWALLPSLWLSPFLSISYGRTSPPPP